MKTRWNVDLSTHEYVKEIDAIIDEQSKTRDRPLNVLFAGCGTWTRFSYPSDAHLVGLDISSEQVEKNTRIHEGIVGDLQSDPLPKATYDIVECWDVLEHIPDPTRALSNILSSLRQGGIAIIGLPNIMSLKGMVTKLSPFWFHKFVYRYVFRERNHDPFPTYLRLCLSPKNLRLIALEQDVEIVFFHLDDWFCRVFRKEAPALYALYVTVGVLAKVVSLGIVDWRRTEVLIVYMKKNQPCETSLVSD